MSVWLFADFKASATCFCTEPSVSTVPFNLSKITLSSPDIKPATGVPPSPEAVAFGIVTAVSTVLLKFLKLIVLGETNSTEAIVPFNWSIKSEDIPYLTPPTINS